MLARSTGYFFELESEAALWHDINILLSWLSWDDQSPEAVLVCVTERFSKYTEALQIIFQETLS